MEIGGDRSRCVEMCGDGGDGGDGGERWREVERGGERWRDVYTLCEVGWHRMEIHRDEWR